jgi:hypothetical protein
MYFMFGSSYFGKINVVPGLFHVATKFGHINYLPLLPMGSAIIIANSEHRMENGLMGILAVEIPFNWKSFFVAYWRAVLWICLFVSLVFLAVNFSKSLNGVPIAFQGLADQSLVMANAIVLVLSGLLLYLSHRNSIASKERALELARFAGFNERLVLEQLAFDGYPLSNPARSFGVRKCKACGAETRGMSRDDGSTICSHCRAVIEPKEFPASAIYLGLLAAVAAVAALFYNVTH